MARVSPSGSTTTIVAWRSPSSLAYLTAATGAVIAIGLAWRPWDRPPEIPFVIEFEDNPDNIDTQTGPIGAFYVVPRPAEEVPAPPADAQGCIGLFDWAGEIGGVRSTSLSVEVNVTAATDALVRVVGIDVEVSDRRSPMVGSHLTCPGRGERNEQRLVVADLDESNSPTTQTFDGDEPVPFDFDVTPEDSETFLITASTESCDCSFFITLHLTAGGQEFDVRIPEEGSFRTTAPSNAIERRWSGERWEAVPVSAPSTGIPPATDDEACVFTLEEAATAVGGAVAVQPGVPLRTETENGDVALLDCTYVPDLPEATDDVQLPLRVVLTIADDLAEAETQFNYLLRQYSRQGELAVERVDATEVDEAAVVDNVFVARRGVELVEVQASDLDQAHSLGLEAIGRLYGE